MPTATRVGRYEVQRELADRGDTLWLLARLIESPHSEVVLERVTRSPLSSPFAYSDFLDRARLQSRVGHPAVVKVHEVGTAGDDLLVVHEYVPGWSLEAVVAACARERHPLPLGFGCAVMADVLRGLGAAHRLRFGSAFVHGGLDLSEIRVTPGGRGKVKGFARPSQAALSRYRSPEHLRGEPLIPASDVYAAGLLLYELLSGVPVFNDVSEDAAPETLLYTPLRPLREVSPAVPLGLSERVMSMVQRERDRTVGTAEELAAQLDAAADELSFSARERTEFLEWLGRHATEVVRPPPPRPVQREDDLAARTATGAEATPTSRSRSSAMLFAGLFLLGVGGSVGAVYALDPEAFRAAMTAEQPDAKPLPAESLVPRGRPMPKEASPGAPPSKRDASPTPREPETTASSPTKRSSELPMGAVTLVTMPEAEVLHRGKRVGKTPVFNLPLPVGTQQLEFVLPDGHRKHAPVEVKEGETSAVRLDLRGLD